MLEFSDKKYQIIYADPPWRYDFSATHNRDIENHYPTMMLNDICCINVPSENNSVLFLWATAPKLLEALEVMKAWGFLYRTHFIWDKEIIGCGWWNRGQHELLLIGIKGKFSPPKKNQRISSVFKERRTKHSKKPDKIREFIDKWYPEKTKIELFARQRIDGWDAWGDQLSDTIQSSINKELRP